MIEISSVLLLGIGAFFFLAGTLCLLRFPDVYTRLHGLTKADNLGLGFILLGLALRADNVWMACKLLLIWPLVLVAGSTVSYLIASRADEKDLPSWQRAEAAKGDRS